MTIREDIETVDTPTGPIRTYVLRPSEAGRYPGIVFYSEIFQITGPIRRSAQIVAGHGYVVALPEIYHEYLEAGTVLAYDDAGAAKGNEFKFTKPVAAYDSDARATLDFLKAHAACSGALGSWGFCIGGHLAYRAGMNADVRATACFYPTDIHSGSLGEGKSDNSLARTAEIKNELLLIWGRQDPHIPDAGRQTIYQNLLDKNVSFQWHEFNAAHAFMRDEGPRYNPTWARIGYDLLLDLFHRNLRT